MSLWRARSNPLAWWWAMLTLVSGVNIALWFLLYRELHTQPVGSMQLMRLRLPLGAAARRRAAHLPVRHLVVERAGRPVGRDRRRGLLRRAMGDHPATARLRHRFGCRAERGVDHRAADPHCRMFLVVRRADHEFPLQRHREF